MKYVCVCAAIFIVLCGTHYFAFSKGREIGKLKSESEFLQTIQKQAEKIERANAKILDFQRVISNNNDECFNKLWPDEIIKSVNKLR